LENVRISDVCSVLCPPLSTAPGPSKRFAVFSSRRRARRDPQRQEVLSIISNFRGLCEDASQEIARHLCFHRRRKPKEDIYRTLKAAERELTALEKRIPVRALEIFKGYTQWYKVVTGDGFPIEDKSASFKSTDDRVTATSDACTEFVQRLG
jgi:hypothetical protein